jgi:thiamine biosynthesis lipoprotein
LVLDLGAVAKGLAVDMAARALQGFENFAIDAGGDLYLAGQNVHGEPWSVGIRHPRTEGALWTTLRVSNAAVCTSGDYARVSAVPNGGHHIVEAQRASGDARAASVTVIAPTAMVADALSTAAFALGPVQGISFLERHGADGFIVTTELEQIATRGMRTDIVSDTPAVH